MNASRMFSEKEEEEQEQEDDSLLLLHKWDRLKAKEERAQAKKAEVGNESDRSERSLSGASRSGVLLVLACAEVFLLTTNVTPLWQALA
eukprot:1157574-Pelagomonas_calceolata.AAC.4